MNAPENCGRTPPQACAGGAFGPQAKPSPAGDGFSGLRPLAPAAPGRPAARPSPCGNPAFIFNTNRIIRSNLYSFRRIFRPLPFGRSASFAKARIHRAKSMQGASLGNGSSPTPPQALCQAKEPGRSPLRPFLYILYFVIKLYIYSTESPMALRLQMPCIILGASKLRGTIRRKKIKNNIVNDGLRLEEERTPHCGAGLPLRFI